VRTVLCVVGMPTALAVNMHARFSECCQSTTHGFGKLILLTEEDADLRQRWGSALEDDGHRVVRAANGYELVDAAHRTLLYGAEGGVVDLVILDARLRELPGLAGLRLFRKSGIDAPMILLCAPEDLETRSGAARERAVILVRPVGIDRLRRTVRTALGPPATAVWSDRF
jgi:DNA-binding response OmpR family regulator